MKLQAHEVALEMINVLRPIVASVAKHDRSLADQLRRAASSVALGLGEGQYSRKGNQLARFHEALGSANETRTALQVAVAWRYVENDQIAAANELLDRVIAMTFRLTHPRG